LRKQSTIRLLHSTSSTIQLQNRTEQKKKE
jgi:hypothetical protein